MQSNEKLMLSDETKDLLRGVIGKKLEKIVFKKEHLHDDMAFGAITLCFEGSILLLRNSIVVKSGIELCEYTEFSVCEVEEGRPPVYGKPVFDQLVFNDTVVDVGIVTDRVTWKCGDEDLELIDDIALILTLEGSTAAIEKNQIMELITIHTGKNCLSTLEDPASRFPLEPESDPVYLRTELSLRTGRTVVHEQPEAKK